MAYLIYGEPGSGSFTAEALLAEAGQPYDFVAHDLSKGEQLRPEYLKVNPMGRIPAVVFPGGDLVTESAAVLLALSEAHPAAGLLPEPGTAERRKAYRWVAFIACNIYEAVGRWDYPERFTTQAAAAPGIKEAAKRDMRHYWELVEREVAPAPFALGKQFSALDVYIANLSRWIVGDAWRAEACPRIEALARIVAERPRIAPVWQRNFAGRSSAA